MTHKVVDAEGRRGGYALVDLVGKCTEANVVRQGNPRVNSANECS